MAVLLWDFSDVCVSVDSLGCDAIELYCFFLMCHRIFVYDFEPWSVDYDSFVDFEEFIVDSVYILWTFEYSGLDDV